MIAALGPLALGAVLFLATRQPTTLAFVLLRAGWVDCEGWDIVSLWAKRRSLAAQWAWVTSLFALALVLWRRGVARYAVFGG